MEGKWRFCVKLLQCCYIKVSTAQCNNCTGWIQGLTTVLLVQLLWGNDTSFWSYCSPVTFLWYYYIHFIFPEVNSVLLRPPEVTAVFYIPWSYCSPVTSPWCYYIPFTFPEVNSVLLVPLKLLQSYYISWCYCSPVTSPEFNAVLLHPPAVTAVVLHPPAVSAVLLHPPEVTAVLLYLLMLLQSCYIPWI